MISAVLPTYNRAPLAFVSGAGSWLTAEDGSRYLDLGAGIAVNALGISLVMHLRRGSNGAPRP